jgi:5'-nucleotidase/UDP-sugar diphosphatase
MRKLAVVLMLMVSAPLGAQNAPGARTITLLHFSDYHSHALPFYSEGRDSQGGLARAIGYLKRAKARGALVFSGGDMINKGSPAWSDRYTCAEWPWLNNVVDAMAFGNHEPDYGREAFEQCADRLTYPILSANTAGFRRHRIIETNGLRLGVFALAGDDFPQLVKAPGLVFGDPVAAARDAVRELREANADAVIMIGHQTTESDYALAKAVEGIDVIFGSHSHHKQELTRIPGTQTWFISPSQYLTYISRLELTVANGRVTSVRGGLVPVDASMREDEEISRKVARMQQDLEADPRYRELFVPLFTLPAPLTVDALGARTVQLMRDVAKADVALSTKSSFRQPLPGGAITMDTLMGALPYDNALVACTMRGDELRRVLAVGDAYVAAPATIDPARSYRVATTDYAAHVAYKFTCQVEDTGLKVRSEVRKGF